MLNPLVAKCILSTVSSIGIIANIAALFTVVYCKYLHNLFGALCGVLACVNSLQLYIFLVWCSIGREFFDESFFSGSFGRVIGYIALSLLYATSYLHLALSLNRFFFVAFPLQYISSPSGPSRTILIILIALSLAVLQMSTIFLLKDCYFVYDSTAFLWIFAETESCDFFLTYVDFGGLVLVSSVILAIDSVTFVLLRKKLNAASFQTSSDKKNNEIMFFIQSLCQLSSYFFCYFFFTIISRYAEDEWWIFAYTTLTWNLMHALEGVIMVVFHGRLIYVRRSSAVEMLTASHTSHTA